MPFSDCIPTFTALQKLRECKIMSQLRSNQFPVAFQRDQLTEVISHAQKELMEYDTTILRLHKMIVSLENDRQNLNRQVHLAQSLTAPIRKLPPEILRRIFAKHGVINVIRATGSIVPGLKIASICSHWRSIAVNMTALWNNIGVRIREVQKECQWSVHHVALVKKLLELSQTSHLCITIDSVGKGSPIPVIPPFLSLLCTQADRWQSLKGMCLWCDNILDALSNIQGRLHCLHTFSMLCPFVHCSSMLAKGASKLRSLVLTGMPAFDTANVTIPWNQIIYVEIRFSRSSEILRILSESSDLRTLKVSYYPTRENGSDVCKHEQLLHSSLTVLDIALGNSNDATNMTKLLDLLDLPNLQSLSITSTSKDQSWQSETVDQGIQCRFRWSNQQLPSFLSRSSIITTFTLQSVWVSTNDLVVLLQRMPALTAFSMSDPHFINSKASLPSMLNDDFLWSISGRSHRDRQPLLTCLTSLNLEGHSLYSFSMQVFVDIIHSRWKPSSLTEDAVACIRTVRLRVREGRILVHPLTMLEKQGLDVVMKDKNGSVLAEN